LLPKLAGAIKLFQRLDATCIDRLLAGADDVTHRLCGLHGQTVLQGGDQIEAGDHPNYLVTSDHWYLRNLVFGSNDPDAHSAFSDRIRDAHVSGRLNCDHVDKVVSETHSMKWISSGPRAPA
jgi:hypothetical protein